MSSHKRYEVIVHEIDDHGQRTTIMQETAAGFIAAAANIVTRGEMTVALADGGPDALKAHIALFISGQYPN